MRGAKFKVVMDCRIGSNSLSLYLRDSSDTLFFTIPVSNSGGANASYRFVTIVLDCEIVAVPNTTNTFSDSQYYVVASGFWTDANYAGFITDIPRKVVRLRQM